MYKPYILGSPSISLAQKKTRTYERTLHWQAPEMENSKRGPTIQIKRDLITTFCADAATTRERQTSYL